jgi:hypothetical protein
MSYAATRDSEQLRIMDVAIAEFILRYTSAPPSNQRRTLFLFPGGMGCQLLRARKPYHDNVPTPQTFSYDAVWLTVDTFLGDALTLKMHQDSTGVYRDLDNRIIVADGAVEFMGCTPYSDFTAWCDQHAIDWFVFGWDWRRRIEDVAAFFLTRFLPHFRTAVHNACGADPLAKFALVGHSAGGMVVNLAARAPAPILGGMYRAVTVATPFYGYGGQIHRYFEGEPLLNYLGTAAVTEVISSLPGCYTLLYLDAATYATDQPRLSTDPQFPLSGYPSVDAVNPAQLADPYHPLPQRYPTNMGFNPQELAHALTVYHQLVAPLPPALVGKFFSIRGVKSGAADTASSITWHVMPSPPSPIKDSGVAPGDGTQPAWTARLAKPGMNAPITITGNLDHMFMMESPLAQQALLALGI